MKKVLLAFLRCLLNNASAYPHIPSHTLLPGPVSHVFSLPSRLKSCPSGSIRVPTCPSAAVAMATSPLPPSPPQSPSSSRCQVFQGWSTVLLNERNDFAVFSIGAFVFTVSRGAGSSWTVSIPACKKAWKADLGGGVWPRRFCSQFCFPLELQWNAVIVLEFDYPPLPGTLREHIL